VSYVYEKISEFYSSLTLTNLTWSGRVLSTTLPEDEVMLLLSWNRRVPLLLSR
jgi:hypothetical protein